MSKVKGIKKLNKAITKEIESFGIKKAKVDTEYSYLDRIVYFKLTKGTLEDEWFKNFILERFGYKVEFPFVISILHEIGHYKTLDELYENNTLYNFCNSEKKRIKKEMETEEGTDRACQLEFEYFNLPDEIIATAWAVNWAKKHPKKVRKMWKNCQRALMEFYKKNLFLLNHYVYIFYKYNFPFDLISLLYL